MRKTVRDAVLTISIVLLIWVTVIIVAIVTEPPPPPYNCGAELRRISIGLDYHLYRTGFFPETDDSFIWVHWYKQYLIETVYSREEAEHQIKYFVYCPIDIRRHKTKYPSSYAFNLDLAGKTIEEIESLKEPVPLLVELNKNHYIRGHFWDSPKYRCILLTNGDIVKEPIDGLFQYRLSVPVEK